MKQKHFVEIPIRQGSQPIWMSAKKLYKEAVSKKPNDIKQQLDSFKIEESKYKNSKMKSSKVTYKIASD